MSEDSKKTPRVAFQGELGAYSDEAAQTWFGGEAEGVPCREFRDVTRAVTGGEADFGVLPVENTLAGSVGAALDALLETDLEIGGEVIRPIRHCLLGLPEATDEGLKKVMSHPVALVQCVRFFEGRVDVEAVAVHDTAGGSAARCRGR